MCDPVRAPPGTHLPGPRGDGNVRGITGRSNRDARRDALQRLETSPMVTTLLWFGLPLLLAVALIGSRTARRFLFTSFVLWAAFLLALFDRLRGVKGGPARLRGAFETLGPTYVKLAQLVASSEGMFPDAYCVEFRKCLDRVPAFPLDDVKTTLR